jgi:hypothetical protein
MLDRHQQNCGQQRLDSCANPYAEQKWHFLPIWSISEVNVKH